MAENESSETDHLEEDPGFSRILLPSVTDRFGGLTTSIDTQTSSSEADERIELDRRSYLLAAGAATAGLTGCLGQASARTIGVDAVSTFGFGGRPAVQQDSLMTVAVGESEPNDIEAQATPIEFGSTVSATLTQSDSDWFAVDVTSGTDVHVEFDRTATSGVTAVILYGPDGDFDNLRYVATDDRVTFVETATESGTHLVQVVDTQSSDGDYTLTVGSSTDVSTPTPTPTPTVTPTPTPTATATPDNGQTPYNGEKRSIPGRIEAEHFDEGGEGVAFHDSDDNSWGDYRTDVNVDVGDTSDDTGQYNVGWIDDGEWLEYTVSISPGTYNIHFRVASDVTNSSKRIRASVDGTEIGAVEVPNTGGWQAWETQTLTDVTIDGGSNSVLRLDFIAGNFNVNWVDFEQIDATETTTATSTPTPTATATPTQTATPTSDDDYGKQTYGEYGYGGISK